MDISQGGVGLFSLACCENSGEQLLIDVVMMAWLGFAVMAAVVAVVVRGVWRRFAAVLSPALGFALVCHLWLAPATIDDAPECNELATEDAPLVAASTPIVALLATAFFSFALAGLRRPSRVPTGEPAAGV